MSIFPIKGQAFDITLRVKLQPTKEALTEEKYDEMENGSEEMLLRVRKPAMKLAEKLFQ
jgi:hypothetical protein